MASLRWAAPETLGDKGVVSKFSDVWSFGMTCLEILTGEHPWMGLKDKEVSNELHSGKVGKHPKRPDSRIVTTRGLSAEMWDLMRKCWSTDPTERPTMTSIKKKLLEMRGLADSKNFLLRYRSTRNRTLQFIGRIVAESRHSLVPLQGVIRNFLFPKVLPVGPQ